MKKLYILLFLIFIYVQSMAQKKCGSDEYYNYQIATDSVFAKNQELLEQATQEYQKISTLKSAITGIIYTIPVVVHVLYNPNQTTVDIADYQIINQIKFLNRDFQTVYDSCPSYFRELQADCQIEFVLAKRDPSGNCTNGIKRKTTDKLTFTMGGTDGGNSNDKDDAKFSSKGGDDVWDPSSYLNIWLVPQLKDGNGNIITGGYAQRPGKGPETDGVVINSVEFLGISRTPTHEIGHWLNLNHIWGRCIVGDGVDDTPNQFGDHKDECPKGKQYSICNIGNLLYPYGDMYMNYMDYTDDNCMNMFTQGQKRRMHSALVNDLLRSTVVRSGNYALIPPKAELSIINPNAPNSVVAGNPITVSFAESNNGSLNAPPNYVNIHLSSTKIFIPGSTGERYLDQYFIEQGVPGRSQTKEFSKEIIIPSDVKPDVYYLFFAADGTRVVSECNANNDTASVRITVTENTFLNPPLNLKSVAGNEQVTLSWLAPSSGSLSSYNIYRSTAENGTYSLIDVSISTNKTILGLSNGTTYWFYVEAIYNSGTASSNKVSAMPAAIPTKPANDDCSGAKLLVSFSTCIYSENQTVNNATASGKLKGSCDNFGTPDLADVWYYFKAQSTSHTITVDPNGSQLDAVIVAYSSCTSSTGINCSDTPGGPGTLSTLNLSGLVIGNVYYIRVYDYGKQTTMGNFKICVSGTSSANSCTITSITPNSRTHGQASFSTTPGVDNIYFNAQPNCSFDITNYCSWITVSPMSGTTNDVGQAFLNYTIEANNSTIVRQCIFYVNGNPFTITQNGGDATDDDNDGIINSLDLCPNTPSGEVVDAYGCADSQVISEVKSLQYNDVLLNTPQNRTISFTNQGLTDFTITSINITGTNANQFSIAPIPPIVVSSGSYQNLTVTFNPNSVGAKSAQIEIIADAVQIPTKTITLNGNGVDHLTKVLVCNPSTSYNFGDIKTAEANSKSFILQNTGSNTLTISNLAIEGLNPEPFSITYSKTVPFDIIPGYTELITVKFSPTSIGLKSATLAITNNSDNLSSKYSIGLSGNGVENFYIGSINNLISLEYWFDDNYQSKIKTAATALFSSYSGAQVSTEGLEPGLHNIQIRYQDNKGKWSSVTSDFFQKVPVSTNGSRKINSYEYWFDSDYATKILTSIAPGQAISVIENFNVDPLSYGLHTYHVRYKDDAGQWSSVVTEFFTKMKIAPAGSRKIISHEYWFDDDYSSKVSAAVSGQTISINSGFDVTALATGLHIYHSRFKDDAGQWSSVVSEFFNKVPNAAAGSRNIVASEYWFDDGFATKVLTPITPGQTISVNDGFDVSTLTKGLHTYHVRYKDDAGQWSSVVSEFFTKMPVAATGSRKIIAHEYWFDDDYSSKVSAAVSGQTISINSGFDVTALATGLHIYHSRFKDDAGQWSSVVSEFFNKVPNAAAGSRNIVVSEYWFDDGFATKVSTPITPGQTISVNAGFEVGSLTKGLHTYHVRYKDDAGQWSSVASEFFTKMPVAATGSRKIIAHEYWFDDDFGSKVSATVSGQTISINGGFDVAALATGLHIYHSRFKDDAGQWSSVVSEFFNKVPNAAGGLRNIVASEYWFDDGFATKVSTPITPGQTISVNAGFEVGSLTKGLHTYHVRYKDDAGQWSSVASEFFTKMPVAATGSRKIIAHEYWFDDDFGSKVSATVSGQTISINSGFDVAALATGLHIYHSRFKDDAGQWSSVVSEFFNKVPNAAGGLRNIVASEYWFDDGYASKISNTITPGQTISINGGLEVGALSAGLHTYNVRYKDDADQWSSVVSEFIRKSLTDSSPRKISTYRYWFDSDKANMITVNLPAPVNPYQIIRNIFTCTLSLGSHSIHFQFRDSNHSWSSVFTDAITKSAPVNPVITASGSTTFCEGTTFTLTSNEAGSYLWSTGATTQSISVTESGSYNVTVNQESGCGMTSNNTVVQVNPLPKAAGTITGAISVSEKQAGVTYSVPVIEGATSYVWTLPADVTGTSTSNNITLSFSSAASSGNLKVAGHNTCGNGTESALAITVTPATNQDIPMIAGWNIFSANLIPFNQNMKDILQPFIDNGKLVKVMDEAGKALEDFGVLGGWNNNIGDLGKTEGYKALVTEPITLPLEGSPIALPMDIPLTEGWNIISYPCLTSQDAMTLVQPLIDAGALWKIMDEAGNSLEDYGVLGGWTNNVGNFSPGKGFKINVTSPCTLTITGPGTKAAKITAEVLPSSHFAKVFAGNGTDHFNIHLMNLEASGLKAGDEIGIFDGKYCVGSATIGPDQMIAGTIAIPASSADGISKEVNGFTAGHRVDLKLFRENHTLKLDPVILKGTGSFEKNGSLFISVSSKEFPAIQVISKESQFRCYPNPFKDEITISIYNTKQTDLKVGIYNLLGQRIRDIYKGTNKGELILKWDGTSDSGSQVVSGVYLCKVNGEIKKVVFEGAE